MSTSAPTRGPTRVPSIRPTFVPTNIPTINPTYQFAPTHSPSSQNDPFGGNSLYNPQYVAAAAIATTIAVIGLWITWYLFWYAPWHEKTVYDCCGRPINNSCTAGRVGEVCEIQDSSLFSIHARFFSIHSLISALVDLPPFLTRFQSSLLLLSFLLH